MNFIQGNETLSIYGLVSPIDGKVVYVGATTKLLEYRLKQHYWHLNEAIKGRRQMNKRFKYLKNLLPLKVSIKCLYTTKDVNGLKWYESRYIKKYREINPDLLNETDGGIGQYTNAYKSDEEKIKINAKISDALKGKSKPEGFAEHLSEIRKGIGNPGCKKLDSPIYAVDAHTEKRILGGFEYGFQVNEFVKRNNAWSNVKKAINHINMRNCSKFKYQVCYGYYWLTWENAKEFESEV